MENVFNSLIAIFLLLIPGLIFGKKQLITEDQVKGMSSFLMNVVLPIVIIASMQMEFKKEHIFIMTKIILAMFCFFLLAIGIAVCLSKTLKLKKNYWGLISFLLFFANTSGLGLPILMTLFDKEAIFYAAIAEIAVDVLLFSLGIILIQLSGDSDTKFNAKNIMNPGLVGIIIGLVLFILKIQIPPILLNTCDKLGGASLPIAMFIIGYSLGQTKLKDLLGDYRVYVITICKMVIFPFLVFIISRYLFRLDYLQTCVLTILMAMPTGSAVVIFCQQYKADYIFASKNVIITTICSLITLIPLMSILSIIRF